MITMPYLEIGLLVLFSIGITLLLVFIGYWMGRKTQTDKPLQEKEPKYKAEPSSEPEGDYFNDEIPRRGDTDERVKTV